MSVVLLTAVSCSQTETDFNAVDANAPVSLGVSATMKGSAQSKAITRSVVDGTKITYDQNNYADNNANPGIGVLLTNKAVNGWYGDATSGYGGHHIWYIGDANGDGWKSIKSDAKGVNYNDAPMVPYFMTADVGQVYAYYPYNKDLNITTPSSAADLQVPVPLLASSATDSEITIDATTSNAAKVWGGSNWTDNGASNKDKSLSAPNDKDYMYFDGTDGRYVNNGRAAGQAPILPADPGDNTSDVNPGYKIDLAMKHALSMVSFRVYDGGNLSSNAVTLTKFVIKNVDGSTNFKVTGKQMALTDGTISNISGEPAVGTLTRNVTNYTLMRQIQTGAESETAFIAATGVNAQTVSKSVSAIVYPQTFNANEIQVVVTLACTDPGIAGDYPAHLTVPSPDGGWNAGKNYIYTLSAGRNRLTVVGVTVTDWTDEEVSGEIPL